MIYKIFPIALFVLFFLSPNGKLFSEIKNNEKRTAINVEKTDGVISEEVVYNNLKANQFSLPKLGSFAEALRGFYKLKQKGIISKNILTLIDFSMSSNSKRLWVIDLDTNTILYNSLVAHGRNTGDEYASSFSNSAESFKSSLGFYATGEIYNGKHGMSLKLDGLEKGINSNARERAVVIHGAEYVSDSFIRNNKRLGRSLGCPAIPLGLTKDIINTIKDKSCLFIYYPSKTYEALSELVS